MARMYYRNAHRKKEFRIPAPGRTAWGAYLLTDDLIHKSITKTADKLKEKTGISKKTQATIAMGTTLAASTLSTGFDDLKKLGWSMLINSACFVAGKLSIDMLVENDDDIGKYKTGLIDRLFRSARLFLVGVGALKITATAFCFEMIEKGTAINNIGNALGWMGLGTALYLVSSGTDVFNRWINDLKNRLP